MHSLCVLDDTSIRLLKLFDAILSDKIISKEYHDKGEDDDEWLRYYCSGDNVIWDKETGAPVSGNWGWKTVHSNFELEHRKQLFKERIEGFNTFNNELDIDSYYLYTIADADADISEDDFYFTVNHLPSKVVEKLVIISAVRVPTPKIFYENFKCIHYNRDLSGRNLLPKVDWDDWWKNKN